MARNAAQRALHFKGFHVIRDTIEIDESLHDDDSITIEACKGSVLIEVPKVGEHGLDAVAIVDRAEELANESIPYGIAAINWASAFEGGMSFIRFTVDSWEAISQDDRDRDAKIFAADEAHSGRGVTL